MAFIKGILYLAVVLLLVCHVSYSESRYPAQILHVHQHFGPTPSLLYRASQKGSDAALNALTEFGEARQSLYWLRLAGNLGDNNAFYALALQHQNRDDHIRWLKKAAFADHSRAQYDLALLSRSQEKQHQWLTQAVEQDFGPAITTLAEWYLLHQEYDQAIPLLERAARTDGDGALQLAQLLWKRGEHEAGKRWFEQAAALGESQAAVYTRLIAEHWQRPVTPTTATMAPCRMRIQPVATSLESARHITHISQQFANDERLQVLPICFNELVWIDDKQLDCDGDWQGLGRLGCDEAQLARQLTPRADQLSQVLVVGQMGKANVNNGIMYLDVADSYSVFVHELAHFVGFVDEYPLTDSTAEYVCQAHLRAPNVMVREVSDDSGGVRVPERWQQIEGAWSLTPTRTCDNHEHQAYKLASKLTFMEFHDTQYIPDVYLSLWQQRLQTGEAVIPAYVNFAQALQRKNDRQGAEKWWQLARDFDVMHSNGSMNTLSE